MPRDSEQYLDDILFSATRILEYLKAVNNLDEFKNNALYADATLYRMIIIGEAVKNLPTDLLNQYPEIEWKQIARFRDLAIHRYFGVNLDIVWNICQEHISPLQKTSAKILKDLENKEE